LTKKIYEHTGNPFVDAGIWAISAWVQKEPMHLNIDDLKYVSEEIVPLYLTELWRKVLYSVFPNNKITNPSVKEKKAKYLEFLNTLINETEPL
jgi:CRISPR-associated protein Cst1